MTHSRMVWALGALRLTSTARMPNRMIWTVAPDAYLQHGEPYGGFSDPTQLPIAVPVTSSPCWTVLCASKL